MSKILELRRKRAALIQKARHLVDITDQEARGLTEQEEKDYNDFMTEIDGLGSEIQRREKLQAMEDDMGRSAKEPNRPQPGNADIGMNQRT